ncbi:MAG: hypothetical protein ABR991_10390 [Terracidiphilus sp.]
MRTTLDDDVLAEVKEYAAARSLFAGEATSVLLKRALKQPTPVRRDGHFFVFSPGEDAEVVTLEHALRIKDESE